MQMNSGRVSLFAALHQLVDLEAKIHQVRYQLACRRVIRMLITPPRACVLMQSADQIY